MRKEKKKVLTFLQNIIRQKNKYDMKKIGKTTRFHKINYNTHRILFNFLLYASNLFLRSAIIFSKRRGDLITFLKWSKNKLDDVLF